MKEIIAKIKENGEIIENTFDYKTMEDAFCRIWDLVTDASCIDESRVSVEFEKRDNELFAHDVYFIVVNGYGFNLVQNKYGFGFVEYGDNFAYYEAIRIEERISKEFGIDYCGELENFIKIGIKDSNPVTLADWINLYDVCKYHAMQIDKEVIYNIAEYTADIMGNDDIYMRHEPLIKSNSKFEIPVGHWDAEYIIGKINASFGLRCDYEVKYGLLIVDAKI